MISISKVMVYHCNSPIFYYTRFGDISGKFKSAHTWNSSLLRQLKTLPFWQHHKLASRNCTLNYSILQEVWWEFSSQLWRNRRSFTIISSILHSILDGCSFPWGRKFKIKWLLNNYYSKWDLTHMQTIQADNSPNSQVSHAKDQIRSEFNFPFILFRKLKLSVCILGSNTSGVTFESFYCICFSYL